MTDQMILHPGEYFIELEFDRPVDPAVLHKALTSMGFGVVVFDQSLPSVEVGAVSLAAALGTKALASAMAPAVKAALSTTAKVATVAPIVTPIQSRYTAPAVVAVAPKPQASPLAATATVVATAKPSAAMQHLAAAVQSPISKAAIDTTAKIADGGIPAALKPSGAVAAIQKQFATVAPVSAVKPGYYGPVTAAPAKGVTPATAPGPKASDYVSAPTPTFPGDVPAAPPPPPPVKDAPFVPVPNDPMYEPPPDDASYSAPQAEYSPPPPAPQYESAPSPEAAAPAPTPVSQASSRLEPTRDPVVLRQLWSNWKEWGSPFMTGPSVSGTGDDDPLRFRVLARLDRPIALDDRPGMRWLYVKALSIPFLSDLVFKANPHTLRQGALYELRFLSRAKSNRTRDSVKQELVDMGWNPIKLSAIKRNMTVPRRPASLTLWYGLAVWNHADSVIVNDDPFFFETVKEIRPQ